MTNQKITYTVPSDDRITADRGDMVAVATFGGANNPRLQATDWGGINLKYVFLDPTTLDLGTTVTTTGIDEVTASVSVNVVTELLPGKYVNITIPSL